MATAKDRLLDFVKNYIAYAIVITTSFVYLFIDLINFGIEENPRIAIIKSVINLIVSLSITTLLRFQGIIHGKNDPIYIGTNADYNQAISDNQSEGDRLDDWCEEKNDFRRIAEIKKRLKYAHLSYEKFENGEYEIPFEKQARKLFLKQYSKRQVKCIKWCNSLEIELWSADYLTSNLVKEGRKQRQTDTSISGYMNKSGGRNACTSVATAIAFGFLTFQLAQDVSVASLIFAMLRLATWLIGGVVALVSSFFFITTTYVESIKRKINALKEFKEWCNHHPRQEKAVEQNVEKVEVQIPTLQTLVENQ